MSLKRRRGVVFLSFFIVAAFSTATTNANPEAAYAAVAAQPHQPLRLPLPPEFANSAITSAVPVGVAPSFQQSHEEKPGSCPQSVSVRDYGWCVSQCRTDMNCSYDQKCCFNGCGTMCMQPSNEVDFALPPHQQPQLMVSPQEAITLPMPIQQEPFGPPGAEAVTPQRFPSGAQVIWNTAKPSAPATFNLANKINNQYDSMLQMPQSNQCPPTTFLPRSCEVQCNQDADCGGQLGSALCCSSGCGKLCVTFSSGSAPKWQVGRLQLNNTRPPAAAVSYNIVDQPSPDGSAPATLEPEYKVLPRTSDKPGACPSLGYGTGGCVQTCSSDQDCEFFYKCCSNGCTMRCVRPIFANQDDSVQQQQQQQQQNNYGAVVTQPPPTPSQPQLPGDQRVYNAYVNNDVAGPYQQQQQQQNFPMQAPPYSSQPQYQPPPPPPPKQQNQVNKQEENPFAPVTLSWNNKQNFQQPPTAGYPPGQAPQMPYVPGYGYPQPLTTQPETQTSLPFVPGIGYGNNNNNNNGFQLKVEGGSKAGSNQLPMAGYPPEVPLGYNENGFDFDYGATRRRRRRTTTFETPSDMVDMMVTQPPLPVPLTAPPTRPTTMPPPPQMVTTQATMTTMPYQPVPYQPQVGTFSGPQGQAVAQSGSPNILLAQQGVVVPETCIVRNQTALDPQMFTMAGSYLQIFTSIPITCTGQIVAWQFVRFAVDPEASFHASVWRRVNSRKLEFELIGSNRIVAGKDRYKKWKTYVVPRDQRIDVKIGQYLGIFYDNVNIDESKMVVPYVDGELAVGNTSDLIEAGVAINTDMREFEEIKLVSNGLVRVTFDLVLNRWRLPALVAYVLPKDDSDFQKAVPFGTPIFSGSSKDGKLFAMQQQQPPLSQNLKRLRASASVRVNAPAHLNHRYQPYQTTKPVPVPTFDPYQDSAESADEELVDSSSEMPQLAPSKPPAPAPPPPQQPKIFAMKQSSSMEPPPRNPVHVQTSKGIAYDNNADEEEEYITSEEETPLSSQEIQEQAETPEPPRQLRKQQQRQQQPPQRKQPPQQSYGSFVPPMKPQQFAAPNRQHRTPPACMEMVDPGNCRTQIVRYYYDTSLDVCKPFIYTGCGGNGNNFRTPLECEQSCKLLRNNAAPLYQQQLGVDFLHGEEKKPQELSQPERKQ